MIDQFVGGHSVRFGVEIGEDAMPQDGVGNRANVFALVWNFIPSKELAHFQGYAVIAKNGSNAPRTLRGQMLKDHCFAHLTEAMILPAHYCCQGLS